MTDKTESATNAVKVDIQDMMVGKTPIPHHVELGYANPMKDQLVDVRAIDVPLEIKLGTGQTVTFQPGGPSSNIECITYSCILMNDLIDIKDLADLLPDRPDTIRISINEWMSRMSSDTLPENWFIQHRNSMMLQVRIEVDWGDHNLEPLVIEPGTEWGNLVDHIQRRSQMIELAQSDGVKKMHLDKEPVKDYTGVQSKPASDDNEDDKGTTDNRDIVDFMKDATGIFNG